MKTTGARVSTTPIKYYNWKLSSPNVVSATINAAYYGDAVYKATDGVRTPAFRSKQRAGELLPFTPFNQVEETWEAGGTFWDLTFPQQNLISRNNTALTAVDLSRYCISAAGADPEVLYTRLMAKMGEPEWDALTFAAELTRLVSMFRDLLGRLRMFLRKYDHDESVDMYLQIRYGLRPLVYDMMAIESAIRALNGKERTFVRKSVQQSNADSQVVEVPWGSITYTVTAETTISTRLAGVTSAIPPVIGFNPVTTLWEVTRLSFVLDWIVDVGTFLEGLTSAAAHGKTLTGLGYSIIERVTITGARISDPTKAHGTVRMGGSFTRLTTIRMPYAGKSMSIPLQFDLDFWKVVDLAAIAKSLTRIHRRNPLPPKQFYYRASRPKYLPSIKHKE